MLVVLRLVAGRDLARQDLLGELVDLRLDVGRHPVGEVVEVGQPDLAEEVAGLDAAVGGGVDELDDAVR